MESLDVSQSPPAQGKLHHLKNINHTGRNNQYLNLNKIIFNSEKSLLQDLDQAHLMDQ
jgi:hypothetical protein